MHQSITIQAKDIGKFILAKSRELDKLNPKELLLYSTALCAGYTVQSIAEKEHVKLLKLEITMSGELDTEGVEGRSQFTSFDVAYNIECQHINDQAKVSRAVQLATDKYCGGLAMLRKIAPVSHSVSIVSIEVEQ
jgi:putative redox protein